MRAVRSVKDTKTIHFLVSMTPPSSAMSNYSTISRSYSSTTSHKSELFIPVGSLKKTKKPPRRSISTYDWSFGAKSVKVQPQEPVKSAESTEQGFTRSESPNGPKEQTTEKMRTNSEPEPKPAAVPKPVDKTRSQSFPQRSTTNVIPEKFYEAQQAQSKEISIKVEKTKKGEITHQEMKLPLGTISMNFEMRSFNLSFPR